MSRTADDVHRMYRPGCLGALYDTLGCVCVPVCFGVYVHVSLYLSICVCACEYGPVCVCASLSVFVTGSVRVWLGASGLDVSVCACTCFLCAGVCLYLHVLAGMPASTRSCPLVAVLSALCFQLCTLAFRAQRLLQSVWLRPSCGIPWRAVTVAVRGYRGHTVRFGKPNQECFGECIRVLQQMGVASTARIVHIGDSLLHDIAGAMRSGLSSAFVTGGVHAEDLAIVPGAIPTVAATLALCRQHHLFPTHIIPAFQWITPP